MIMKVLLEQDLFLVGQVQHGVYDSCDEESDLSEGGSTDTEYSDISSNAPESEYESEWGGIDENQAEWNGSKDARDSRVSALKYSCTHLILRQLKELDDIILKQVNEKPVTVPSVKSPFPYGSETTLRFWEELQALQVSKEIPNGYGFKRDEENYQPYCVFEFLTIGKKRTKDDHRIVLPREIWLPRMVLWVQALQLLYTFLE
jgi:hypothetical protein